MRLTIKKLFVPALLILLAACNNSGENNEQSFEAPPLSSCKLYLLNKPAVNAGETAHLSFKAVAQPHDTIPDLGSTNGKKIDLVVASADLSYYDHLYLTKDSAGIYPATIKFPFGGDFLLIAEYTAIGLKLQTDTFHITVNGTPPRPAEYKSPVLLAHTDGYTVELLSKKLRAYVQAQLVMKISKDGKPVFPESLQPVMGEQTHMVCVNTSTKATMHTTSKNDPMSYWYLVNYPGGGLYKTWVEFKQQDKIHRAEFVVEVGN